MIQLVIILVIAAAALGGGFFKVQQWKSEARAEGRAQCQAELKAADDALKAKADELSTEVKNHEDDIVTAFTTGETFAKTKTVYLQSKGAADVARNPSLSSAQCTLPPDLYNTLNAARAGIRSDASGVRAGGDGSSPGSGPAANPAGTPEAVRGANPAQGGNAGGPLPKDAGGRGPLGKVHPKG